MEASGTIMGKQKVVCDVCGDGVLLKRVRLLFLLQCGREGYVIMNQCEFVWSELRTLTTSFISN